MDTLADMPLSESTAALPLNLDANIFLRTLLHELVGRLEDIVGVKDAAGIVSAVGGEFGGIIDEEYRIALGVDRLDERRAADVIFDLKRRIGGAFYIIERTAGRIVLGNRACPFDNKVAGRPSFCALTSNMFGKIAARNLGYAKVELQETIAKGASSCFVTVYFKRTSDSEHADGREYYRPG